jgi:hypothetical protein
LRSTNIPSSEGGMKMNSLKETLVAGSRPR